MKVKILMCCLLAWALFACNKASDRVKIQGEFANLQQGEFFIYSSDGAIDGMDSLHIRDGKFLYELPLTQRTTLHILYPNFSQLTIFAQGGDELKIKGDARNLSEVTVEGSDDNELYTKFRQEVKGKKEKEVQEQARDLMLSHPHSMVSPHLFTQYFLLTKTATRKAVTEVFDSLMRANPED
ncbi:MAG: DUF4369 domain-containing protein, partial [Bacteroidaceae bacterium]|nr:DUF4369 domain-containing protein [Bacteroidaceae bacterium]